MIGITLSLRRDQLLIERIIDSILLLQLKMLEYLLSQLLLLNHHKMSNQFLMLNHKHNQNLRHSQNLKLKTKNGHYLQILLQLCNKLALIKIIWMIRPKCNRRQISIWKRKVNQQTWWIFSWLVKAMMEKLMRSKRKKMRMMKCSQVF